MTCLNISCLAFPVHYNKLKQKFNSFIGEQKTTFKKNCNNHWCISYGSQAGLFFKIKLQFVTRSEAVQQLGSKTQIY